MNEIEVKKPMLLSMDSECKIPDKVIFHLINNHIPFFIVNGYMPEAGKKHNDFFRWSGWAVFGYCEKI